MPRGNLKSSHGGTGTNMQNYIDASGNMVYGDKPLGGRLPTAAEQTAYDLAQARAVKIAEMSALATAAAEANFVVINSLGTNINYIYPNKWNKDQHNLMGQCARAINNPTGSFYFICLDPGVNGIWMRRLHTAAQILAIGQVSGAQVEAATLRYETKYNAIMAATTVAAVNAVVW